MMLPPLYAPRRLCYPIDMKVQTLDPGTRGKVLQEWQGDLEALLEDVTIWSKAQPGWSVKRSSTAIEEEGLGRYEAPVITVETGNGRLVVEPMARIVGGIGTVEISAWPSLYRVRLLRRTGTWVALTDSGITLNEPWNEQTFVRIARDLIAAS